MVRYDAFGWSDVSMRFGRPHTVFWLFALGWFIQRSRTPATRVLASALVLITLAGYFPGDLERVRLVQAGLLAVIWLPTVPMPRMATPAIRWVASASLWIYLTHFVVWPFLNHHGVPAPLGVIAYVAFGVLAAQAVGQGQCAALRIRTRRRPKTSILRPDNSAEGLEPAFQVV